MKRMPAPPPPAHPGYYRDVDGALRWWDGQQWTEVATGEPQQPQQSPPPQQPAKKPDKAKIILLSIGGVIVGLVFLGSCINLLTSADSTTAAPAPTVTVTATATQTTTENVTEKPKAPEPTKAAPKPEPEPEITDGDYLVGSEIKPGTYKSNGESDDLCYADTKSKSGEIMEQEIAGPGEKVIIRVTSRAYTFSSSDCGTWTKVG